MQERPLKIISLNIEMDRHIDRIVYFFKVEQPDVVLLQEVLDKDRSTFEQALEMKGFYIAQNILRSNQGESSIGLLTLSKVPILQHDTVFYKGNNTHLLRVNISESKKIARAFLVTEVTKDRQHYCLVNIHFTWSHNAEPTEEQHKDLDALLPLLFKIPEFILCGDFNAPRGTAIFDKLASRYKDNIPNNVTTTIDKQWHRGGDLNIVVDGVFSTEKYQVEGVRVVDNVSDHCAVVALVRRYSQV